MQLGESYLFVGLLSTRLAKSDLLYFPLPLTARANNGTIVLTNPTLSGWTSKLMLSSSNSLIDLRKLISYVTNQIIAY